MRCSCRAKQGLKSLKEYAVAMGSNSIVSHISTDVKVHLTSLNSGDSCSRTCLRNSPMVLPLFTVSTRLWPFPPSQ